MFGASLGYLVPESKLGQLVNAPVGRWLYVLFLVAVFVPVTAALEKMGIKILTRKKKDDV